MMLTWILGVFAVVLQISAGSPTSVESLVKRSSPVGCDENNEGRYYQDRDQPFTIWLCRNRSPLQVKLPVGATVDLAGRSCRDIQLKRGCTPPTGRYSINVTDDNACEALTAGETIQVMCENELDLGGWTLVWKHSYRQVSPLNETVKYYSSAYKPCTDLEDGWCNIPNKAGLKPKEMMIAAYHEKQLVYAYKGDFNPSLDSDWTGGILPNPEKVVDHCSRYIGIHPAPYTGRDDSLLGLAFDKHTPWAYNSGCDTISNVLASPAECRWSNCILTKSISKTSKTSGVQMTVAIYVR